ncbi:cupin domain-containing protein [Halalkalibaculum sp. DA3122]|uniref:cupin domain-containing protein n=1 Tax=unclassified Halalkalibaculum TaxID=2964617 RepID=UPI00375518DE
MMILLGIGLFIASYLSVGYLFHLIIFPETRPDPERYFEPGDVFETRRGGNKLEVLSREGDNLQLKLTFNPNANGPPVHIQTKWDEYYKIRSGELTLTMDGEEQKLGPGEEITIPRGVPHKPSNPADEPVVCEVIMPAQFVVYLSQIYGFMDEDEKNAEPPRMIFQMALSNQYFDSYLGEGPPVWLQKILNFLLLPAARLMGYKSFYEKYRI